MFRIALSAIISLLFVLVAAGCPRTRTPPPASAVPDGWVELFPDQDWNDVPQGQGEIFTGLVRYVPGSSQPSFVMRYNAYKLERSDGSVTDIYCGSDNSLTPYLGLAVDIEGRLETMEVEGQAFIEIWPARIRPSRHGD
jgi:hypothetical protein